MHISASLFISALPLYILKTVMISYMVFMLIRLNTKLSNVLLTGSISGFFYCVLETVTPLPDVVCAASSVAVLGAITSVIYKELPLAAALSSIISGSVYMSAEAVSVSAEKLIYSALHTSPVVFTFPASDYGLIAVLLVIGIMLMMSVSFRNHNFFIPLTKSLLIAYKHLSRAGEDGSEGVEYGKGGKKVHTYDTFIYTELSIIVLFLLSAAIFTAARTKRAMPHVPEYYCLIIASGLAAILLMLCAVRNFIEAVKSINTKVKYLQQDKLYSDIVEMDKSLRAQRHDFINHMQVVQGLISMTSFEKAKLYMEKLFGDVKAANSSLCTGITELNALLFSKLTAAKKMNVSMTLSIPSPIASICIPPFELVKVVGNLVDNALFAAAQASGERTVDVKITETGSHYMFTVSNSGPEIEPSIRDKIFLPGVTTKKSGGEGYGLYIVKCTLESYNSDIGFSSCKETGTSFTVRFPKKVQNVS